MTTAYPTTAGEREQMTQGGARFTGHIVGAHIAGQLRAEKIVKQIRAMNPRGDELLDAAIEVTADHSHEGAAAARGFFRAIQKALEQRVPT